MLESTPLARIPLLTDTAIALLLFLLSGAIGLRLLRRFHLPELTPTERGIFAFTLGLGAVTYVPFVLFALRIGKPPVVAGALVGLFAVFWRDEVRIVRWIAGQLRRADELPRPAKIMVIAVIPLFLITFLQALCPPTDADGLHYHLTAPQLYLREGRFFYAPTFLHLNWPLGIEMLFGAGMAFHWNFASGLIQYGIGLVVFLAIYCLCLRIVPERSKDLPAVVGCVAVALCLPWVRAEMSWAYIDLGLGLDTILAGYALQMAWQAILNNKSPQIVGGLWMLAATCAGLSATAKLPGLLTIVLVSLMIAGQSRTLNKSAGWKATLRPAAKALGIGLLIVAPWLIRCWVQTNTPIYPYFAKILPVVDWSPAFQARLNEYLQYFLTFRAQNLTPEQVIRVRLIACALLAGMAIVGRLLPFVRPIRALLFYVLALMVLQIASSGIYLRYFLPYIPLMAVLAVWCLHRVLSPAVLRYGAVILGCLWIYGLHKLPQQARGELAALSESAKVAVGSTSREAYLTSRLPGFPIAQWCNAHLPADSVIVLATYDAPASLFQSRTLVTNIWMQDAIRYDSVEIAHAGMQRLGATHLIFHESSLTPASPDWDKEGRLRAEREMPLLNGICERWGTRIYQQDGYSVYLLERRTHP